MCVVASSVRYQTRLAGLIPHVQLLRCLASQRLFQLMRDAVGVYKHAALLFCHVAWRVEILPVGVAQCVVFYHVVLRLCVNKAQLLVVVVLHLFHYEVASHHGIHQYRYAALLACLHHKASQVGVKRRARVGMSFGLGLLVVVAKLYHHIVARLHLVYHLLPASLCNEAFRRAAVDSMVVYNHLVVEEALEHHAPPSFRRLLVLFVCHRRVTYHKHAEAFLCL